MGTIKTVVQTTNLTTPVVANYKNFIIQTVPLNTAAGAFFEFVVKNKLFYPEQNVQLTPVYNGTGLPIIAIATQSKFAFTIRVTNVGPGVLNAPLSINVSVINA